MISIPLSDEAWARIEPMFGDELKERRGRPRRNPRPVLNAILWVTTHNAKWRHLPSYFPPSQTCYAKWSEWRRSGLMDRILAELDAFECEPQVDATTRSQNSELPGSDC